MKRSRGAEGADAGAIGEAHLTGLLEISAFLTPHQSLSPRLSPPNLTYHNQYILFLCSVYKLWRDGTSSLRQTEQGGAKFCHNLTMCLLRVPALLDE